jgi:hypothetical protein
MLFQALFSQICAVNKFWQRAQCSWELRLLSLGNASVASLVASVPSHCLNVQTV